MGEGSAQAEKCHSTTPRGWRVEVRGHPSWKGGSDQMRRRMVGKPASKQVNRPLGHSVVTSPWGEPGRGP